ncbi:putative glycosyl transferase, family 20 [Helianthus anomalus]
MNGMNLVSYEFLACQASKKGLLVLSEFFSSYSELDDTVAEAQLRTKQIPPQLQIELAVDRYQCSSNRMIILGFNETLTNR